MRGFQAHGVKLGVSSGWRHNGLGGRAYPVRLWRKLPDRLPATVDRLKEAEIRNRPAVELIEYYRAPDCLIYVDPPYVLSTRAYGLYADEMSNQAHADLLDALDRHSSPVVQWLYPSFL